MHEKNLSHIRNSFTSSRVRLFALVPPAVAAAAG